MYGMNPRQVIRAIKDRKESIGGGPQAIQAIFEAEGALVPNARTEQILVALRADPSIGRLHEIFEDEGARVPRIRVRAYLEALREARIIWVTS